MITLPTAPTEQKTKFEEMTVLIYGTNKIGKSTFCSQAKNALFLAFEPGLNALSVNQIPITSWKEALEALALIAKGGHKFETIIIDTVDMAYKQCLDYICAEKKITHPSELEYGKGFALVNNEFQRVLNKLALLPYGLIMVSHAKEKEKKEKGKDPVTIIQPTMSDGAATVIMNMSDFILFCDFEFDEAGKEVRVIRTKPTANYKAGDRYNILPETIPLSYNDFIKHLEKLKNKKEGK